MARSTHATTIGQLIAEPLENFKRGNPKAFSDQVAAPARGGGA